MRRDAVIDGRLANLEIIARPVRFTLYEQRVYKETSAKIKEISARLQAHDPITISKILMNGGPRSSLAKSWFANVRKRKEILNTTNQKFNQALNIVKEHPNKKIMIFSETIESIQKLKKYLRKIIYLQKLCIIKQGQRKGNSYLTNGERNTFLTFSSYS
jgi:superfamily II DNA or RNA helicase